MHLTPAPDQFPEFPIVPTPAAINAVGESHTAILTPQEVKDQFAAQGIPVSEWAEKNGFPCNAVYRVLNGFTRCKRGQSHAIAVALGLKPAAGKPLN